MKNVLVAALIGAPFVGWLVAAAPPAPQGPPPPPPPTAQVSSGPSAVNAYFPAYGEGKLATAWAIKVSTNIGTATLTEITYPNGSISTSNFLGGLNSDVGTVMIKSDTLQPTVNVYTAVFVINGSNPPVTILVPIQNPQARAGATIDFGGLELIGDFGDFPVTVVDANGSLVATYYGEAMLTVFSLRGSRARVDQIGPHVPVAIEAGEGTIFLEVFDRVPGDTLIFELAAPRLDTTRSTVGL